MSLVLVFCSKWLSSAVLFYYDVSRIGDKWIGDTLASLNFTAMMVLSSRFVRQLDKYA